MEQDTIQTTSYCGHCHRQLPVETFYTDCNTQKPDRYCIACRKEISRTRYRKLSSKNNKQYPVITNTQSRKLRMSLIRHALQVVNESVARKQKQLHELEYQQEL